MIDIKVIKNMTSKNSEAVRKCWKDPDFRETMRKAREIAYNTQEYHDTMSAALKKTMSKKSYRKKRSKISKEMWKNEEYRTKITDAMNEYQNKDGTLEKQQRALHVHHVDLDHSNTSDDNLISMSGSEHMAIHRLGYRYILEKYGVSEIHEYLKWFKNNWRRKEDDKK